MGLVSKTRVLGYLGQRQIAIFQKLDGAIDAATQDELMYRQLRHSRNAAVKARRCIPAIPAS